MEFIRGLVNTTKQRDPILTTIVNILMPIVPDESKVIINDTLNKYSDIVILEEIANKMSQYNNIDDFIRAYLREYKVTEIKKSDYEKLKITLNSI